MNYSPLNDPGFEAYRNKEKEKAAAKRRKKTLIILSIVSVVLAAAAALIVLAAFDTVPRLIDRVRNAQTDKGTADQTTKEKPSEQTPAPQTTEEKPTKTTDEPTASETAPTERDPAIFPTETTEETETPAEPVKRATTVYVDAGHGFKNMANDAFDHGTGNAATPFGLLTKELYGTAWYESDLTIILAKKVRDLLETHGYTVIMSREDYVDEPLPIGKRAERAKAAGADLLVSIHADASGSPSAYGARVFYNDTPTWIKYLDSKGFAQKLAERIDAYGASGKKTKVWGDTEFAPDKPLAMLRGTGDIPSVLVETLFLTNEDDAKRAVDEEWQNKMASAIADTIIDRYPLSIRYE